MKRELVMMQAAILTLAGLGGASWRSWDGYYRGGDCASQRLAGTRPHCPFWRRTQECVCAGKLGRLDSGRDRFFALEQPAPTLLRFRA